MGEFRRLGTDWGLVASMLLTIALLSLLYAGFFGVFVLLGAALPGVIAGALLLLLFQYLSAERLMLRSAGLAGFERRPRPFTLRTAAWLLLFPSLPWVVDAMAGMSLPYSDVVGWSVALLILALAFYGLLLYSRRISISQPAPGPAPLEGAPAAALDRLAMLAGTDRPRLLVAADPVPYAMAVGLSPKRGAIIVSRGLLEVGLEQEEMEAVLAHELAHLIHHDSPLMVVAGALGALIGGVGSGIGRAFSGGSGGGGGGGGGGGDGGGDLSAGAGEAVAFIVVLVLVAIVFLALAYLADFLLTRTLSRYRELAADRGAAVLTSHPENLAGALVKLQQRINHQQPADLRLVRGASALMICPAHRMPQPERGPVSSSEVTDSLQGGAWAGGLALIGGVIAGALIGAGNGWGYLLAVATGVGGLIALGLLAYAGLAAAWHAYNPQLSLGDEVRILTSTHPSLQRRVARLQAMTAGLAAPRA